MQLSLFVWCQLSRFLGIVGLCKSYSLQAEKKYLLSWFGSCTPGLSIIMWQQIRLLIGLRKRRTDGVSVSRWSREVMDGWKVENNSSHSFGCLCQSLVHTHLSPPFSSIWFLLCPCLLWKGLLRPVTPTAVSLWLMADITDRAPRRFSCTLP